MSGLFDGEQIMEESIPATKLQVVGVGTTFLSDDGTYKTISGSSYSIQGDITGGNSISVTIPELNMILYIEPVSSSTARLGVRTISGTSTISVNRFTKYDTSSYEGYVNDSLSINETISYVIDGLVYINSNDRTEIEFASGEIWYCVKYFISNGGANVRIKVTKQN